MPTASERAKLMVFELVFEQFLCILVNFSIFGQTDSSDPKHILLVKAMLLCQVGWMFIKTKH